MPAGKLYSVSEAKKQVGISTARIRAIADKQKIGTRTSAGWVFTEQDIERLRQRNTQSGRPRKEQEQGE